MRRFEELTPWIAFSVNLTKAPAKLWALLGECNAYCAQISGIPLIPDVRDSITRASLAQGILTTANIRPDSLTQDEALKLVGGTLTLPPSRRYEARAAENMLAIFGRMEHVSDTGGWIAVAPSDISELNIMTLDRLVLPAGIVPGGIRTDEKSCASPDYPCAPAEDCAHLLERLCDWLNSSTFTPPPEMNIMFGILRAVLAHLYLVWIHPFADANTRTARLVEHWILLSSGIPAPAAFLMSRHYRRTRSDYLRQMERASRPDGKIVPFVMYAVRGFRDTLVELLADTRRVQADTIWKYHISECFRDRTSPADLRRRDLAVELTYIGGPVPIGNLRAATPRIATAYAGKTQKTFTRDVDDLIRLGLAEKTPDGIRTRKESVRAFG